MKYLTFTRQDTLVLYGIVYPYSVIINYLLVGSSYFSLPLFIWITLITALISTCSWVMHIVAANILRHVVPSYTKTVKRILIQLPVYMVLTILLNLAIFTALHAFDFIHYPLTWHAFQGVFVAGILLNIISTSSHEGLYTFEKWKLSLYETEVLKKNYLQSQLDSLKSQVNPHFLFNSLNCLSSLITSDPDRAGEFLDEMSKVYRYLLRSNENELTSLAAELQFVNSFFHMLKTRYGDGIKLEIDVREKHYDFMLPPLTLQMLIENAVKHNVILKSTPLQIRIFSTGQDALTVSNNIQKKSSKILSNRIGLQNIATKYQLLNHSSISVIDNSETFAVSLPLIKNVNYESADYRR